MKHTLLTKLAVAATLVLPLTARAQVKSAGPANGMTWDKAEAAAAAAISEAPKDLELFSQVPVEFAPATVAADAVTQGALDRAGASVNPTKPQLLTAIGARSNYWKSVSAALASEKTAADALMQNPAASPAVLIGSAQFSIQITRYSLAADALAADADQDAAFTASLDGAHAESNQELLDRKAKLFQTLSGLKGSTSKRID